MQVPLLHAASGRYQELDPEETSATKGKGARAQEELPQTGKIE